MNKGLVSVVGAIIGLCIFAQIGFTTPMVVESASGPIISVEPSYLKVSLGEEFTVNITVNPNGVGVGAAQYDLYFNSLLLNVIEQTKGPFLSQDGASTIVITNEINNTIGKTEYGEFRTGVDYGVTTPGVLATITFKAMEPGTSTLNLSNVILSDPYGYQIEGVLINNGTVVIKEEQPPYPANCTYFLPEHSTGAYCQNNTIVQVRVNTTVECYGPQADIYYDTSCVNITAVDFTGSAWYTGWECEGWSYPYGPAAGHVRILGCNIFGASGDNLLAKITLNCTNKTCDCTSNLHLVTILPDYDGKAIPHTAHNGTFECKPEIIPGIDLNISMIDAYHGGAYGTSQDPWLNLSNEIEVTVENIGTEDAGAFNISLYINDEFFGKKTVSGLDAGNSTTVRFEWTPIGCDCTDDCNPETYTLKAIADCDDDITESNENNNESIKQETAYWNGYAADEPLQNFAHGKLRGGLLFTTGDSVYGSLSAGKWRTGTYNISLPEGAEVELARLNVYYTWTYPQGSLPQMEVRIKNQTGTYVLSADKKYDDRKCWGRYDLYWGNWVYDVTRYIQESGTYEVTVNCISGSVCLAGPGIMIVYRDDSKPMIEYWLNEGADILEVKDGYIYPWEAITNASFKGCIYGEVVNASLGVVNPWANTYKDGGELFFNNISLGKDVYCGGMDPNPCTLSNDVVYMEVGRNPQVAISLSDVKNYLNRCDNYAGIGDIHDIGMMPSNAFLVVEYAEEQIFEFDTGPGTYPSISGTHNGTITPNYDITVNKLYTYPCTGTGGHTEFVKIWNETTGDYAEAHWDGYAGDYHNISFNRTLILRKGVVYNYTIRTGSYPQIIHAPEFNATGGKIKCSEFIDANGVVHKNWIPAIRLWRMVE